MMIGVHQPNFIPWLGFFRKLALSDYFVFLDDVQFSKGSFCNRVKILEDNQPVWLTVPTKPPSGTLIKDVPTRQLDWPERHLSRLRNAYRGAAHFKTVWPTVETLFHEVYNNSQLAECNIILINRILCYLNIDTPRMLSSALQIPQNVSSTERLIQIVSHFPQATTYFSGIGGQSYQDEGAFAAAGIQILYQDYNPKQYPQNAPDFVIGLSVLDAAFNVGWSQVRVLLALDEI